jgi:hypothetical protein
MEALTKLLSMLTEPEYKSTIVILAGYQVEMDTMLARNAGLKSRFQERLDFPHWPSTRCQEWVFSLAEKALPQSYHFDDPTGTAKALRDAFQQLSQRDGNHCIRLHQSNLLSSIT